MLGGEEDRALSYNGPDQKAYAVAKRDKTDKCALFSVLTSTNPEVLSTLQYIGDTHSFSIYCNEEGTWVNFPDTRKALDWVGEQVCDTGRCVDRTCKVRKGSRSKFADDHYGNVR